MQQIRICFLPSLPNFFKVSTMAMRHRKLFPSPDTNKTINCADNCEPSCPYDACYLYPDYTIAAPPASTKQGHHISPYVIIIVAVVGSVLLLLSYYVFMVKYCSRLRRSAAQSDGPEEEFLDHNHGPVIDHPIWYINTVGLQPSVISSITVVKYSKGDGLIEGTDCSVCLNEFREDETLKLLPKCNHAFHIPCIDTWLRSHTNCPLCRAGILSNTCNVVVASNNDQNSRDSGLTENMQMENLESGGELDGNQVGEIGNSENRTETGEMIDFALAQDDGKEIENSEKENDVVIAHKLIQPMRRSVSIDGAAEIALTVREICSTQCEESLVNLTMAAESFTNGQVGNSRIIRTMGSSSIAYSLHRGPVSMKRSFSYGER